MLFLCFTMIRMGTNNNCFFFQIVKVIFTYFEIEPSSDTLSFYNGETRELSKLIITLSGLSYELPIEVNSYSSKMYIKFRSDGSNTYSGFTGIVRSSKYISRNHSFNVMFPT